MTTDEALRRILEGPTYEVMPFRGTEQKVLEHVPTSVRLTVTASPGRPLGDTVALAVRLTEAGYRVAPHLAARMLTDRAELADLVARMRDGGVSSAFVIGGDGPPAGEFSDALTLLRALDEIGHGLTDIGIGGYPEGHPAISDDALWEALRAKAPYATHLVTQVCFDTDVTWRWASEVRRRGVDLPISVGMPGAVARKKLVRIAGKIGLGDSARFLTKQQSMLWRFFLPGGYRPDKIVRGLTPHLAEPDCPVRSFHLFTFNDLEGTEAWRQRMLRRLAG